MLGRIANGKGHFNICFLFVLPAWNKDRLHLGRKKPKTLFSLLYFSRFALSLPYNKLSAYEVPHRNPEL